MSSRPFTAPLLIASALCLFSQTLKADFIFKPGEGWRREGGIFGSSKPVAKTADLQLALAEDFEKKGDLQAASEAYKILLNNFKLSRQAATAQFKLAQILDKSGRFENAFDSYDQYISLHPEGKEFPEALDAMFEIAKRFMNGERRRLLGIRMFSSNQRAEEMFDTILKRAPYSSVAAETLLLRGVVMERQGKDAEAIASYQQILERFPGEKIAQEAQYQMGFVRMRSVRQGSYDKVDRVRAQEAFEDYLSRNQAGNKSSQARENLKNLEDRHLKSMLEAAMFYEKTGKPKAAAIYYRDIIDEGRNEPSNPNVLEAKQRLDRLKGQFGADAVKSGNAPAENAENAASTRKMYNAINTTSRADYVGPAIKQPQIVRPDSSPALKLLPSDLSPLPEPELPPKNPASQDASKGSN